MIFEGIVTTLNPDGSGNVAPMGPEFGADPGIFLLKPFRSSTTFRNLIARREGVWHASDDVLLLAKTAIGREVHPATTPASRVEGQILADCCYFREFRVIEVDDRGDRALIRVETVAEGRGASDWPGLNRARHAVVEAAILATRTDFLPIREILDEFARLASPIHKTGGDREREAFALLESHVREAASRKGMASG